MPSYHATPSSISGKTSGRFGGSTKLLAAGITPLGGGREPIDEPIIFAWGAGASLFLDDTGGNLSEYISMLPDPPRPELGLVTWSEWQAIAGSARVARFAPFWQQGTDLLPLGVGQESTVSRHWSYLGVAVSC